MESFTCVLCHEEFTGFGNNPAPLVDDPDARCCNTCDQVLVIPHRLALILNNRRRTQIKP